MEIAALTTKTYHIQCSSYIIATSIPTQFLQAGRPSCHPDNSSENDSIPG